MHIASALSTLLKAFSAVRCLFHMFMGKQVILAVLIIPITFRAETELKTRIIQLCPAADCAAMLCAVGVLHMRRGLPPKLRLARFFLRRVPSQISR